MLTRSDSKSSSVIHKHQKLQKKRKSHKHLKKISKIDIAKASNLDNYDVQNLMPVSHQKANEQCESQLDFHSELISIKQEPISPSEYSIRGPVFHVDIQQGSSFINDTDFSISEDTKTFLSDRLNEKEECDPLSIEESTDQEDLSDWIKKFTSLPLYYVDTGKPFTKCPACGAVFFSAIAFQNHILSHFYKVQDLLMCSYCKFTSEYPSTLFSHLFEHQDQCEVCNKKLSRKNVYERHCRESKSTFIARKDHSGRFTCFACKVSFDFTHQLRKHWFKHTCNDNKTYQCNSCNAQFETVQCFENHKCLSCPVCDKSCDSISTLKSHTRYVRHFLYCSICSYEFSLRVDHEKHMELHKKIYRSHEKYKYCLEAEDESCLQCELCAKIFRTEWSFTLHAEKDHNIKVKKDKKGKNKQRSVKPTPIEIIDLEEPCGQVLANDVLRENLEETDDVKFVECKPVALFWRYPTN